MTADSISRVEWGTLESRRPRHAGSNARLGAHGDRVPVPLARLTMWGGASGFGLCRAGRDRAADLLGRPLSGLFLETGGVREEGLLFESPLWDLAGQRTGRPVYALLADAAGQPAPAALRVPCYDTSLYFDDLHLESDEEAAALLASEARAGYDSGHRAFKIKVGRGARHLPLEAGTKRDIAIIRAIRAAVGPEAPLMLDANNGWNLNLTKRVLEETADCHIHWMEEAFHEDPVLYRDLKEWLHTRGIDTLIADGEGDAAPALVNWACEGLVDVLQYDIFGYGVTCWLALGKEIAPTSIRSAPHHYGAHLGNYVTGHLAAVLPRFEFIEWDEVYTPSIDASAYVVDEGFVTIPDSPGFGLTLDETLFQQSVQQNGFVVT